MAAVEVAIPQVALDLAEVEEQYLFCYVLRAGNVAAKHGATVCVEATAAALAPGVSQGAVTDPVGRWLFRSGVSCVLRGALKRVLQPQGELRRLAEEAGLHVDHKVPGREIDQGIEVHPGKSPHRDG